VLLGAVLLQHVTGRGPLPAPLLLPTMAILVAPPALAGNAWFALVVAWMHCARVGRIRGRDGALAAGPRSRLPEGAVRARMVVVHLPLQRVGRRRRQLVHRNWFTATRLPLAPAWATLLLAALTAFIAFVLVRTVVALARHRFLPRPAQRQS
jgi:tellurite resistance protein